MPSFKLFNPKGDLFATGACFFAQAVLKLGSSLILTRIVHPEAYGVITLLLSIAFVVEMLADLNVTLFIVRDEHGDTSRYLNTAWTMRLVRSVLNSAAVFLCAPFISSTIYHLPSITPALRVFSLWFIIGGLESMSFSLAVRQKRSRVFLYSELAASFIATAFAVAYTYFSRDYWGMLFGTLLSRALTSGFSHLLYRQRRPRLQWDWAAAREILRFTKYTMPSSLLTLGLSQFDKVALLRLSDLAHLGVYGLAANIASQMESLIAKISQMVLYPRVAHNFRTDRTTFSLKYYSENTKLFISILLLPAAIGGAAQFIVGVLYPAKYAQAGEVLQALMLRAVLLALASPAEDLLIAAGESQVILFGNVLRAAWLLAASLIGYHFFGFIGFVYGIASSGLPPLLYYLALQKKKGFLIARYEVYKVVFCFGVAMGAYLTSSVVWGLWRPMATAF